MAANQPYATHYARLNDPARMETCCRQEYDPPGIRSKAIVILLAEKEPYARGASTRPTAQNLLMRAS